VTWLDWYNNLDKPAWTPQPATIGLIWQALYPVIAITFAFVFVRWFRGKLPGTVALPFILNLIANLAFTPIQFGIRNLPLAALDIVFVWVTILWMIIAIWQHHKWIAVAQVPYGIWVSIATVLQLTITWNNWS